MRKTLLLLGTIALAGGVLSGCSGSKDNQPSASGSDAGSGKATGGTIKIVRAKDPRNLPAKDMIWYKNYTKVSGININWEEIPGESASEKVNLMLSTNKLPDAFLGTLNTNMVMKYSAQNLFLPLEDYIQDMPNFSKMLEQRPEYKAQITAPDGHIYGLPYIEEMFGLVANQGILHIYKPWLDKLGLPMPTTIDEYRDTLKKFVTMDPNGNGKADEIGLALANKDAHSGIGSFGRNANDFGQWFGLWGQADRSDSLSVDANGKVFSTATTDAYKTGVEYLHQMYMDGLIDPEFLITDGPKMQAKLTNPDVIVGSLMTFSISDVVGADRAKDYVAVPYLKGPGGEMGTRENYSEMHNPVALVLTKDAKDPKTILKWADGLYDPSWSVQTNWGPLGYQYKLNDKGVMVFDTLKDGLETYSEMRGRNTIGGNSPVAVLKDYYDKVVEYPQDAQRLLNDMKAIGFVDKHLNDPYIPNTLFYDPATSDRMAILAAQVYGVIDNNRRKWITDGGVDKDWDNYLKELDKAGWNEFIGYVQKAYSTYMSNVK
ncbi:extracellular solute-binding protein [Paenibacillus glycanilyticus]|uniref:extracellular solute-binding protein n=1 Tax=Paenibacillus glycanilyticus TaxID=126569 RepID=UPI003EB8F11D